MCQRIQEDEEEDSHSPLHPPVLPCLSCKEAQQLNNCVNATDPDAHALSTPPRFLPSSLSFFRSLSLYLRTSRSTKSSPPGARTAAVAVVLAVVLAVVPLPAVAVVLPALLPTPSPRRPRRVAGSTTALTARRLLPVPSRRAASCSSPTSTTTSRTRISRSSSRSLAS